MWQEVVLFLSGTAAERPQLLFDVENPGDVELVSATARFGGSHG